MNATRRRPVLPGGRPRILADVESLDVDHAEDVTPAMRNASACHTEAFRSVVFSYLLRWWVTEPAAIATVWNRGDWCELVAQYACEERAMQLDLADRRTGEGE